MVRFPEKWANRNFQWSKYEEYFLGKGTFFRVYSINAPIFVRQRKYIVCRHFYNFNLQEWWIFFWGDCGKIQIFLDQNQNRPFWEPNRNRPLGTGSTEPEPEALRTGNPGTGYHLNYPHPDHRTSLKSIRVFSINDVIFLGAGGLSNYDIWWHKGGRGGGVSQMMTDYIKNWFCVCFVFVTIYACVDGPLRPGYTSIMCTIIMAKSRRQIQNYCNEKFYMSLTNLTSVMKK